MRLGTGLSPFGPGTGSSGGSGGGLGICAKRPITKLYHKPPYPERVLFRHFLALLLQMPLLGALDLVGERRTRVLIVKPRREPNEIER